MTKIIRMSKPLPPWNPMPEPPEEYISENLVLGSWGEGDEVTINSIKKEYVTDFINGNLCFRLPDCGEDGYDSDYIEFQLVSKTKIKNIKFDKQMENYQKELADYNERLAEYEKRLAEWEKSETEYEIKKLENQISYYESGRLKADLAALKKDFTKATINYNRALAIYEKDIKEWEEWDLQRQIDEVEKQLRTLKKSGPKIDELEKTLAKLKKK